MKTDKYTVSGLFNTPRRYLIPLFQRGYVWKREPEWGTLWRDIADRADAVTAASGQSQARAKLPRKHFLGALVLQNNPVPLRRAPTSDVIDGQQRLTTLQIFLIAFRAVVRAEEADRHAFVRLELERLTQNTGAFASEDDRHKIWPTNAFRDVFAGIADADDISAVDEAFSPVIHRRQVLPRSPLVDAFLYFAAMVRIYLSTGATSTSVGNREAVRRFCERADAIRAADYRVDYRPETQIHDLHREWSAAELVLDEGRTESLFHAVSEFMQLVVIDLDHEEDDPQVIFETLNGRGVPLGASDLVRNFLFLSAARGDKPVQDLYERYWKQFDESATLSAGQFWSTEMRQGRFKRSRLDLFFFHLMKSRTAEDIKLDHLYQAFRDWWYEEEDRSVSQEMASIHSAGAIFRTLILPDANDRWGKLARQLNVFDTSTAYPLLLWLGERRDHLAPDEFDGMLLDLESFIVRRAICGLTAKNYNRLFLGVLQNLKEQEALTRSLVQAELLRLEGESSRWPADDEFIRALISRPLYRELGPTRMQAILRALNDALLTSKHEQVHVSGPLTVEHVLPQVWNATDWPFCTSAEMEADRRIRRYNALESLGNLTLLTDRLNASVSNGPFRDKRSSIATQSLLPINVYFQQLTDEDCWDEAAIAERGNHLAVLALKIWPRPTHLPEGT